MIIDMIATAMEKNLSESLVREKKKDNSGIFIWEFKGQDCYISNVTFSTNDNSLEWSVSADKTISNIFNNCVTFSVSDVKVTPASWLNGS